MPLKLYLNNVPVPIKNYEEIKLDFSFDDFSPNLQILENFLPEFEKTNDTRDPFNIISNWIDNNSVLKKIPLRVEDSGQTVFFGKGLLSSPSTLIDELRGKVKLDTEVELNQFSELIKSFRLLDLYEKEGIPNSAKLTRADFGKLRTVRNNVPQYLAAAILSLAFFQTFFILYNLSREIADAATKGVLTVAYVAASVLYISFTIASLYAMLKEIQDALFPAPRAYAFINAKKLLERALLAIGYTLDTNLFDGDYGRLSLLASTSLAGQKGRRNTTNQPIPDLTLDEYIQFIADLFYAKAHVDNQTKKVTFKRTLDFLKNPVNYTIQELKDNGNYRYTVSDAPKSISLRFAEDFTDLNVVQNRITVSYGIRGIEEKDLALTNQVEVNFPFATVKRKGELDGFEKTFLTIINTFKKIGNLFSKNDTLIYKPNDYKSFATLGQDSVSVGRVFISDGEDGVSPNSDTLTNAEYLYDNFHQVRNPLNNQYVEYLEERDREILSVDDFLQLKKNNVCYDWNGKKSIIKSHVKDPLTDLYQFTFRTELQPNDKGYIPKSKLIERKEYGS